MPTETTQLPVVLFPLLVLFTIGQRLLELLRSRHNQATMRTEGFARVDSAWSYLFMVAVHATWFVAMLTEHWLIPSEMPNTVAWLALAVFWCAQMLRVWAIRSLGSQGNVQVMTPAGRESPRDVVADGPYRYVRHPNYLAVMLEFFTLPLVGGAPVTAVAWSFMNGVVLFFRIRDEESHLRQRPGYDTRFAQVPCLIPRLW